MGIRGLRAQAKPQGRASRVPAGRSPVPRHVPGAMPACLELLACLHLHWWTDPRIFSPSSHRLQGSPNTVLQANRANQTSCTKEEG